MSNEKYNINIALCESFDENTKSASKFLNEIGLLDEDEIVKLDIVTIVNYIGNKGKNFKLDYFMVPISLKKNKEGSFVLPLFMTDFTIKKVENEKSYNKMERIVANNISSKPLNISFLGEGLYEIQVYEYDKQDEKLEKDPIKRYKDYKKNNKNVITALQINVTCV